MIKDFFHGSLEAGHVIIETNTFNSTRLSMADYQLQDISDELNLAAAQLARRAADEQTAETPDKPRFVAGGLGHTRRTASTSPGGNLPYSRTRPVAPSQ